MARAAQRVARRTAALAWRPVRVELALWEWWSLYHLLIAAEAELTQAELDVAAEQLAIIRRQLAAVLGLDGTTPEVHGGREG